MSRVVQEKFEVRYAQSGSDDAHSEWVSDKSARVKKGTPEGNAVFFNTLPPGMDIEDQEVSDIRQQPTVLSGTSDVSMDTSSAVLKSGYTKREMRPTDDMYTREHNDAFYDDVGGFCERNNYLDRS